MPTPPARSRRLYFDGAATSHPKPPEVYSAVDAAMRRGGSAGRGSHVRAVAATRDVFAARTRLAGLLGLPDSQAERVLFTRNCTEALNLALWGWLGDAPRDRAPHVLLTSFEHNAVIRPLNELARRRGITYTIVEVPGEPHSAPIDLARAFADAWTDATRLVVMPHASNVTGALFAVEPIAALCRQRGALLLLDAAQTAGEITLDAMDLGAHAIAMSGHKGLLGPQGTGALWVSPDAPSPEPLIVGGTGSSGFELTAPDAWPDRYEGGTLNVPALAGLAAGLEWLTWRSIPEVRRHRLKLWALLFDGLRALDATVYGPSSPDATVGVLSFNLPGIGAGTVGTWLDREHGIAVRTGLHCAPLAHQSLGTELIGTVRLAPGPFTTTEEVRQLLAALAQIRRLSPA